MYEAGIYCEPERRFPMPVPERGYPSTGRATSTTFGAMNIDQLRDLIAYSRQVLELLLAVSSIFGGFAITGVVALRAEERRDRLHATAFFAFTVAALAFIGATALDAIWLPVSRLQRLNTVRALSRFSPSVIRSSGSCSLAPHASSSLSEPLASRDRGAWVWPSHARLRSWLASLSIASLRSRASRRSVASTAT